jgi:hypothetical protein
MLGLRPAATVASPLPPLFVARVYRGPMARPCAHWSRSLVRIFLRRLWGGWQVCVYGKIEGRWLGTDSRELPAEPGEAIRRRGCVELNLSRRLYFLMGDEATTGPRDGGSG